MKHIEGEELFCPNCGLKNESKTDFCNNPDCRTNLNTDYVIYLEEFQTPEDRNAIRTVRSIPALPKLLKLYMDKFGIEWVNAKYLGTGVRVSERQFPEIYSLMRECAKILAEPKLPKLYISQGPLNAITTGTNTEPIIVLYSRLIDAMTTEELKFIIGHEMGHVKCNHVLYHTLIRWLSSIGVSLLEIKILTLPVLTALLAWSRRSEYSADRAGLIVQSDLEVAKSAIAKFALGSRRLYEEIDIEEYMRQQEELQRSIGRWQEYLPPLNILPLIELPGYTHPFTVKRVNALAEFSKTPPFTDLQERIESFKKGAYVPPKSLAGTMVCPSCRAVLPVGCKFCRFCGSPITEVTPGKQCPSCGGQVAEKDLFCPRCGAALGREVKEEEERTEE